MQTAGGNGFVKMFLQFGDTDGKAGVPAKK
jgi:hypothetical protein